MFLPSLSIQSVAIIAELIPIRTGAGTRQSFIHWNIASGCARAVVMVNAICERSVDLVGRVERGNLRHVVSPLGWER